MIDNPTWPNPNSIRPNWVDDQRTPEAVARAWYAERDKAWAEIEPFFPLARLYARVFAGWPWYEVSVCASPACSGFSQNEPGVACPSCGSTTREAYPEIATATYIAGELKKAGANLILAADSLNQPISFAWGFRLTGQEFTVSKYKTGAGKLNILQAVDPQTNYYYISEVGVDPAYQGKKIGTRLSLALATGNSTLLMRTKAESPMLKIATNQLRMTPVVAPWLHIRSGKSCTCNLG